MDGIIINDKTYILTEGLCEDCDLTDECEELLNCVVCSIYEHTKDCRNLIYKRYERK